MTDQGKGRIGSILSAARDETILIAREAGAMARRAGAAARPHLSTAATAIRPAWSATRAGGAKAARWSAAHGAIFAGRVRVTGREALAAQRRRPTGRPSQERRLGLRPIELWTVVVSAIFAVLVFVDAPAIVWARGLDRGVVDLFRTLTDLGKSEWLLVPLGLACLWLAARPMASLSRNGRAKVEAWLGLLTFAFVTVAGSGLIVTLLKRIIGRARPKHFDTSGVFDFSPFTFDASYASFPSGHATTVFAIAAVVTFIAPKLRWPALALALWLALSRVVIGSHYPSDALAGAAFALWFALRARAAFAGRGFVFDRDLSGRYRLKNPRLLASAFTFGRPRGVRTGQPEAAE